MIARRNTKYMALVVANKVLMLDNRVVAPKEKKIN